MMHGGSPAFLENWRRQHTQHLDKLDRYNVMYRPFVVGGAVHVLVIKRVPGLSAAGDVVWHSTSSVNSLGDFIERREIFCPPRLRMLHS